MLLFLSLLSCYALWFISFSLSLFLFLSTTLFTHLPIAILFFLSLAIHVLCAENENAKYLNSRQPAKHKHKYKH
uniref:Uncharacterized protein n=1 Tax=Glossina palpalis gambiensis TaxID=67801 RepID=A0A1B0C2I7_9MUSC